MGNLEKLDPNYVIVFPNKGQYEEDINSVLRYNGLATIVKPGNDKDTCYMFTRIDTTETYIEVEKVLQNLKFVISYFPIFDNQHSKSWDSLYMQLNPSKFVFPTPKPYQLKSIAEISKNPKISCYFEFFNYYNNTFLKNMSVIGFFFWLISSKSFPYEFNRYYSIISNGYSLYFLTSWLYSKKKYLIYNLNQYSVLSLNRDACGKDSKSVFIKKLLSIPIIVFFGLALVAFQLFCFGIEIYLTQIYPGRFQSILALLPTVLISVYIPILTLIYDKFFVQIFVDFENSANPPKSILQKKFVLLFLTNYMPLLITLFLYLPFGHLFTEERIIALSTLGLPINTNSLYLSINTSRHQKQFFYFIFTNQIIIYVTTYVVPIFLNKLTNKKGNSSNTTELTIKNEYPADYRYWKRANTFHVKATDTFNVDEGFQRLILQFGFVAMFSTIWPLAPLIVFLINQIVFKTDLWKCFKDSRLSLLPIEMEHAINKATFNLDPWDDILRVVTWVSVIVCGTITYMYEYSYLPGIGHITQLEKRDHWYTYNPLPKSWSSILLFVVVLEHACILVFIVLKKYFLEYQDSPMTQSDSLYGVVPEINLDFKESRYENVQDSRMVNDKETDVEVETIDTMQSDQGYKQLSNENVEYRQRKNNTAELKNHGNNNSDDDDTDALPEKQTSNTGFGSRNNYDTTSKKQSNKYEDESFQSETGTILDPSVVYCNNFALSDSSVAGATLPPIIPTSKNYHLRFDENGNQISPNPSMDSEMVHNTPTITSVDKENVVDVVPVEKDKKPADENTPAVTIPEPISVRSPPVITVEAATETAVTSKKGKETNNPTGIDVSKEDVSNKSLKFLSRGDDPEKAVTVDQKSLAASTSSKNKSLISEVSHKLNKTKNDISSSTHHHKNHGTNTNTSINASKQNNVSVDMTKKKKKKGLFGKLKI